MRGYEAYKQQRPSWTRIEMLLAAFEGTISRLEQASEQVQAGDRIKAQGLLIRAQRLVIELYSGLDMRYGLIPEKMKQLYLYVMHKINRGDTKSIQTATRLLRIIHGGLESIRDDVMELERSGKIPQIDNNAPSIQNAIG